MVDRRRLTHAERANELIEELDTGDYPPSVLIQIAQLHATMALVEAVSNLPVDPPPPDEPPPVPYEQTREGWTWDD